MLLAALHNIVFFNKTMLFERCERYDDAINFIMLYLLITGNCLGLVTCLRFFIR